MLWATHRFTATSIATGGCGSVITCAVQPQWHEWIPAWISTTQQETKSLMVRFSADLSEARLFCTGLCSSQQRDPDLSSSLSNNANFNFFFFFNLRFALKFVQMEHFAGMVTPLSWQSCHKLFLTQLWALVWKHNILEQICLCSKLNLKTKTKPQTATPTET